MTAVVIAVQQCNIHFGAIENSKGNIRDWNSASKANLGVEGLEKKPHQNQTTGVNRSDVLFVIYGGEEMALFEGCHVWALWFTVMTGALSSRAHIACKDRTGEVKAPLILIIGAHCHSVCCCSVAFYLVHQFSDSAWWERWDWFFHYVNVSFSNGAPLCFP